MRNLFVFIMLIFVSFFLSTIYSKEQDSRNNKCVKFIGNYYKIDQWEKMKKSIECMHNHGHWRLNRTISFDTVKDSASFGYHNDACEKVKDGNLWQYEYITSPRRCNIPPKSHYSAKALCSRLSGRNLIVLGDSMNFQFFVSLVNLIAYDMRSRRPFKLSYKADKSNKDSGWYLHKVEVPCDMYKLPKFNLSCMRSDRLDLFLDKQNVKNTQMYPAPRLGHHELFHEYDYLEELREYPNSVVLMNRGAHFIDTQTVLKDLKETFTYLLSHFKDATFIWRTTATGHHAEV